MSEKVAIEVLSEKPYATPTSERLLKMVKETPQPENNIYFRNVGKRGPRPSDLENSKVRKAWEENSSVTWTMWFGITGWWGDLRKTGTYSSEGGGEAAWKEGDSFFFDSYKYISDLQSRVESTQADLLKILTESIEDWGLKLKKHIIAYNVNLIKNSPVTDDELLQLHEDFSASDLDLRGILNDDDEYTAYLQKRFERPFVREVSEQITKTFGQSNPPKHPRSINSAIDGIWQDKYLRMTEREKALVILIRREIKIAELAEAVAQDKELKELAKEDPFFNSNREAFLRDHIRSAIELDPDVLDEDLRKIAADEAKKELKFTPQCFLLYHMKVLRKLNRLRTKGLGVPYEKTFILDTEEGHSIMNRLTKMSDPSEMLDLPTWEMAKLVPNLRLYKILYEKDSQQIVDEVEFKFPNFTYVKNNPNKLLEATESSLVKTKQEYGIKSFDWKYIGTDPFTYKNDVEATLVLYLQDFEQLKIKRTSKGHEYRLLDLLVPSGPPTAKMTTPGTTTAIARPSHQGGSGKSASAHKRLQATKNKVELAKTFTIKDKYYYDIKAQVGWANKEDTKKNLFLTMVDYDIQFSQEGVFELTINYRARLEGTLYDKRANVLRGSPSFEKGMISRSNQIKRMREQGADNKRIAKLTDEMSELRRANKEKVFSEFMLKLKRHNSIYFEDFTTAEILSFQSGGRSSIVQGGRVGRQYKPGGPKSADFDIFMDAIKPYKKPPDPEDGTEAEEKWRPFLKKINQTAGKPDEYRIHYFFLGDLIELMAQNAIRKDNFDNSTFVDQTSLLLSGFELLNPQKLGERLNPRLTAADIPISVETFNRFFFEKVISYDVTVYPLMKMIRDIMSHLVINIFDDCFGKINIRNSFRLGFFSLDPKEGQNPMEVIAKDQRLAFLKKQITATGVPSATQENHLHYRIINMDKKAETDPTGTYGLSKKEKTKDAYHFFIVYGEAADPASLRLKIIDGKPDYKETYKRDLDAGIYHLYLGRDRGLVKNISFAKTDQEYLREQRFTQESEVNPYAILSNVFDVTIQMYGNTLFYPGQRVFIYPSGGFTSLGRPWIEGSNANTLGLGGYHIVTEVSSKIESGKFETTLKARWETSGDGISQDPSVNQSRGTGTVDASRVAGSGNPLYSPQPVEPAT